MWLGSQSDHFASHVSIDWRLGGPQSRFGHSVEERSFYTCREPNSGYQAHSQPRDWVFTFRSYIYSLKLTDFGHGILGT